MAPSTLLLIPAPVSLRHHPPPGGVYAIRVLPDGLYGIGGFFTQYNGVNRDVAAILNPDGSLDPDFSLSTVFKGVVRASDTQPGYGKIIIGGQFNRVSGQVRANIARLNPDAY